MQRMMFQCVDHVMKGTGRLWKLVGRLSASKTLEDCCFFSCSKTSNDVIDAQRACFA